MPNPDIAIIINSFNRLPLLKECLGALSLWVPHSSFKSRCIGVIYDAGSTDGSIEWLRQEASNLGMPLDIIIPRPGDDTSFASGLNTGVRYAEEKYSSLRYLLFYETDNQILEPKALLEALSVLQTVRQLAACGFTVRRHDGSRAGVGQSFPTLLNFFLGKNLVQRFQLEAIPYQWRTTPTGISYSEVDIVYTSPLLVRLDAWKESGGLDATAFPFSDCDVDWARRLWNLGWRMGVIHSDSVIHDNKDAISAWSKTRAIQAHRGRLRYFRRHHPTAVFIIWPALLMLRHVLELVSSIFVKESVRRSQLSRQFFTLFKDSVKGYQ